MYATQHHDGKGRRYVHTWMRGDVKTDPQAQWNITLKVSREPPPAPTANAKLQRRQPRRRGASFYRQCVRLSSTERRRREASATKFYFLHASKVRGCSMERLPRLQDLKRTPRTGS